MRRLALSAVAGIALAGCGASHMASRGPHSHPPVRGFTPVVLTANRLNPDLLRGRPAQLVSPTQLAILTNGSSSCPSVPTRLVVDDRHTIRLDLAVGSWVDGKPVASRPSGGVCTADYGTTRVVVAINPTLIDVHHGLTLRVFYPRSKKPEIWSVPPLRRYPVVVRSPDVRVMPRKEWGNLRARSWKFVSRTRLGILTMGSRTCKTVPSELTVLGRDTITMRFAVGAFRHGTAVIFHGSYGCTLDLGPARMLVAVDPKLIDVNRPLTVRAFFPLRKKPTVVTVAPLKS